MYPNQIKHHVDLRHLISVLEIEEKQFWDWVVANFEDEIFGSLSILHFNGKYHPDYKNYPLGAEVKNKGLSPEEVEIGNEERFLIPISKEMLQEALSSDGYRMFLRETKEATLSIHKDENLYHDYHDPLLTVTVYDLLLPVAKARAIKERFNNIKLFLNAHENEKPFIQDGSGKIVITKSQALMIWALEELKKEKGDHFFKSGEVLQKVAQLQKENEIDMVVSLKGESNSSPDGPSKVFGEMNKKEPRLSELDKFNGRTWVVVKPSEEKKKVAFRLILPLSEVVIG